MPERRSDTTLTEMRPEHREALAAVLEYLWEAERKDCLANPSPDHIFMKLALLRELCGWTHQPQLSREAEENTLRAERFAGVLPYYPDTEDYANATNLLADCMHWCRREGISFEEMLRVACDHFRIEQDQEHRRAQDRDHPISRLKRRTRFDWRSRLTRN